VRKEQASKIDDIQEWKKWPNEKRKTNNKLLGKRGYKEYGVDESSLKILSCKAKQSFK